MVKVNLSLEPEPTESTKCVGRRCASSCTALDLPSKIDTEFDEATYAQDIL